MTKITQYDKKQMSMLIIKPMPPTAYEWEGPIYGRDERSEGLKINMLICIKI